MSANGCQRRDGAVDMPCTLALARAARDRGSSKPRLRGSWPLRWRPRAAAGTIARPIERPSWRTEMRVGVPTEIKQQEGRVALTPAGARELIAHGHEVLVQAGAGAGSRIPDEAYALQGATVVADRKSTRLNSSHTVISYAV